MSARPPPACSGPVLPSSRPRPTRDEPGHRQALLAATVRISSVLLWPASRWALRGGSILSAGRSPPSTRGLRGLPPPRPRPRRNRRRGARPPSLSPTQFYRRFHRFVVGAAAAADLTRRLSGAACSRATSRRAAPAQGEESGPACSRGCESVEGHSSGTADVGAGGPRTIRPPKAPEGPVVGDPAKEAARPPQRPDPSSPGQDRRTGEGEPSGPLSARAAPRARPDRLRIPQTSFLPDTGPAPTGAPQDTPPRTPRMSRTLPLARRPRGPPRPRPPPGPE